MSIIWDNTNDLIDQTLDLRSQYKSIIASNIANADTPEFKAMKMEFEEVLQQIANGELPADALDQSTAREPFQDPDAVAKANGNTVNRDKELVNLAKEQALYNAGVTSLNKRLAMLKYAITEGGGGR